MKDAWATSGISKLEAYGKKINGKNSTSAYTFAFLYILFWKRSNAWVMQLERSSSFNYPFLSYFQYATYPFW